MEKKYRLTRLGLGVILFIDSVFFGLSNPSITDMQMLQQHPEMGIIIGLLAINELWYTLRCE